MPRSLDTMEVPERVARAKKKVVRYYQPWNRLPLWIKCTLAWAVVSPVVIVYLAHVKGAGGVGLGMDVVAIGFGVVGSGTQNYAHYRWNLYVKRLQTSYDDDGRAITQPKEPDRIALWVGLVPSEAADMGNEFRYALYSGGGLAQRAIRLMNLAFEADGGEGVSSNIRRAPALIAEVDYRDPAMLEVYERLSRLPVFSNKVLALVETSTRVALNGRHLDVVKAGLGRVAALAEKYGHDEYAWALVAEFTERAAAGASSDETWRKRLGRYDQVDRAVAAMLRSETVGAG